MPFAELFRSPGPHTWLALSAGTLAGIGVLLLIRAGQVWRYRETLGYGVYAADALRKRLMRWGWGAMAATVFVGAGYIWQITHIAFLPAPESIDVQEVDPLAGMRLQIPRLGITTEIIEAPFVARQWDISRLRGEVAHLAGTAYPGQPGNAVLAGHITIPGAGWGPFQELEILQPGDRVFIEQGGQMFIYEVTENLVVDPGDVHLAFPTEDTRLTLVTCSAWDDALETYTKRIVVIALLVP